jgi:hypothetical protein
MRIFPVLKQAPLKNDPPSPAGRSGVEAAVPKGDDGDASDDDGGDDDSDGNDEDANEALYAVRHQMRSNRPLFGIFWPSNPPPTSPTTHRGICASPRAKYEAVAAASNRPGT